MHHKHHSIYTLFFALFFYQFTLAQCPNIGDLVITEIMPNPAAVSDTNGEYFEVYNATQSDIDLINMIIKDDDTNSHTIGSSVIVPAGGYIILGRNDDMTANGGLSVAYVLTTSFSLRNTSPDQIIIECNGIEIDRVNYDTNFPIAAGEATSLSTLHLNETDNNDFNNWCLAKSVYGAGDLGTPGAANDPCFVDCPNVGDLVITEIMSNPAAVSDADGEYFEIYNPTNQNINLFGMIIKDTGSNSHLISSSVIVPASGYVVLGRNGDMTANGGISLDYVIDNSFTLISSADEIIIECENTVIDRVDYDTNFPNEAGKAISLAPTNLTATDNDDFNNWCLAQTTYGAGDFGTPSTANSNCNNDNLPVDLLHFTAKVNAQVIQLNWQTANEIQHDQFIIERSDDGNQFVTIGQVAGKNLIQQIAHYEFMDQNPLNGSNFYRLRLLDFSGKSTYSALLSVDFSKENKVQIYPNPVVDQLHIGGQFNDHSTYQIINQLGKTVQQGQLNKTTILQLTDVSTGVYFLHIYDKNKIVTQRFMKQ